MSRHRRHIGDAWADYLVEALTTGAPADAQLAARRLERLRFDDAEEVAF